MTAAPATDFLARRLGSAIAGVALIVAGAWITLRNLSLSTRDGWIFWVPIVLWLVTMGLLCCWTVLRVQDPASRARIGASWRAGWLMGGLGLGLGFFGPLVLSPGANLGPLLGILLTGPVGFVLGALGAIVAFRAPESR